MKKSITLLFIAAATALLSLCGAFFTHNHNTAQPVEAQVQINSEYSFSLDKARSLINLCALSYDETELLEAVQALGYTDFEYICRNQDSTFGSGIAFGIAVSKQESTTQVLAIFRGTNKGEWYSNFQIGEGIEHAGFAPATDFAQAEVERYLEALGIDASKAKILITGHSRGGAVANLLAKRLTDEAKFSSVTAYTFASPNTTTAQSAKSSQYNNIYNLINPEDFICYIPLTDWGYTKYGVDLEFPRDIQQGYEEQYAQMQQTFEEFAGYSHIGYPMGGSDVRLFLRTAAQIAPTLSDYYNKELTVTPHRMTLDNYMQKVAALLCGDNTLQNGMFLVSSGGSNLFDTLTQFMMEGIQIEDVAKDADITTSAINCGHTYETYSAWLSVLDAEYFERFAL
ncbi:MAG: DUF2974 domain-containing protein [Ruminococcus sp.]|nr:DUF2974 domain-containing protein [Ruminococcus sp.]